MSTRSAVVAAAAVLLGVVGVPPTTASASSTGASIVVAPTTSSLQPFAPLPLLGRGNHLGTANLAGPGAPGTADEPEGLSLSINGPCTSKDQGDLTAARYTVTQDCTGTPNPDHDAEAHQYVVSLPAGRTYDTDVLVFDGAYVPLGRDDGDETFEPGELPLPDAFPRDFNPASGVQGEMVTAFRLFAPDPSGADPLGAPLDADPTACTAATRTATSTAGAAGTPIEPRPNGSRTFAPSSIAGMTNTGFAPPGTSFLHVDVGWWNLCRIPASAPAGDYTLLVTNANDHRNGSNNFAVVADPVGGDGLCLADDPSCPTISARRWASVRAVGASSTSRFPILDLPAAAADGTLRVSLWDPAEGASQIRLLRGTDVAALSPVTISWSDGAGNGQVGVDAVPVVSQDFNGRTVVIEAAVPEDLGADERWYLEYQAAGPPVLDRTTWWADLALPPGRFSDVGPDHPFAAEIDWAADNDVTGGYPDGTFRGGNAVTRQAFAAFLARYWVSPDVPASCSTKPFPDVAVDSPFCPQITWLKTRGLATGYPDGTFRPAATISRQALAAFLYRFRGAPHGPDPTCDAKPAVDVPVGHAFCGEIAWLADVGLTTATPSTAYNPAATATRQAAVTFLHRLDPGCAPATEPTGGCPRPAVPGDYDGDRTADPMWVHFSWDPHPPTFTWYLGEAAEPVVTLSTNEGHWYDGDLDGNGRWDPAVVDITTGEWTTATAAQPATLPPPAGCAPADGGATPLLGDWDGDRRADPGWYCFVDGTWHLPGRDPIAFGEPAPQPFPPTGPSADVGAHAYDVPAPADYDGDGTTDLAVYRPRDGSWWVHGQDEPIATGLGIGYPTPADLDGDGDADPLLQSLIDGRFERAGADPADPASASVDGLLTRMPAVGDHDGDGIADLADVAAPEDETTTAYVVPARAPAIREATDGIWRWMPTLFPSSSINSVIRLTFLARACTVGSDSYDPTCPRVAVPGDMDGDRRADLAWREETGIAWGIAGVAGRHPGPDPACRPDALTEGVCIQNLSVAGDWDGDGVWDHGAYVGATGTWEAEGVSVPLPRPACAAADPSYPVFEYPLPVPGQWDTDWATDPAWYCPSDGTWHFEDGNALALGVPGPHSPSWLPDGEPSEGFWYDVPVPGFDADGDGVDDPAVYRPTDGTLLTAAGVAASGLGLGLPLVGQYNGERSLVTIFQPSADTSMDPPPQPDPHRWRFSAGGPAPIDVPLDPARPYLMPALLDVDGDGTDELAGIARDQLGGGTTEQYLVEGRAPVEFYDEWAYLPMTMPAPTIYRFIPVTAMLATCRTTDACPAALWP